MIVLTKIQAEAIRGKTSEISELDPVCLEDGVTWILPEMVLLDPKHSKKFVELQNFSKRVVAPSELAKDPDAKS